MPYLTIRTNQSVDDKQCAAILPKASRLVAQMLNKPEEYVMVQLEPSACMAFAGTSEPLAFVELRAIGLPTNQTGELARGLCDFIRTEFGIPGERVFINFTGIPANLWGWNGETF